MSIFITKIVQYNPKVEAFERRGLSSQIAAKVSDVTIMSLMPTPILNLVRYGNMSDELNARINGQPSPYAGIVAPLLTRFSGDSPFGRPTLFVEMKTGGEVLNAYGMFEVATSKIGCYGGQPTTAQFRSVAALGIDYFQTVPAGNVNIAGYMAFVQAWRGIRAFFAVGGGKVRGVTPLSFLITGEDRKGIIEEANNSMELEGDASGIEGGKGKGPVETPLHVRIYQNHIVAGGIKEVEGIVLIDATMEGLRGHIFPYFKEMLEPDYESTFNQFASLYRFCLDNGAEPSAESLTVHRRGFRQLANSHAGRMLQHIYLGVRLAIETGNELALIRDGSEYTGFALLGTTGLVFRNQIKEALPVHRFEEELARLNSHKAAIQKFYDTLIEIPVALGGMEEITVQMLSTNPRYLRKMVQSRAVEDLEPVMEELNATLGDMKYVQEYWEINEENLVRFLDAMRQRQNTIDFPMYVHPEVVCNRSSSVLEYLSVFGSKAPSIYHGSVSKGIARPGAEDPNLEITENRRAVPHLPYVKKGLIAANSDWATAYRTKAFRFTPAKKGVEGKGFSSAKHRDGVISGRFFDAFYTGLREWIHADREERPKLIGKGKRRAEDGDDEVEERPAKKARFVFT